MKIYFYNADGRGAIMGPFTGVKIEYCQHLIIKTDTWEKEPLASYDDAYGWNINRGIMKNNSYSNIEIML
jgi:hypothetical protein